MTDNNRSNAGQARRRRTGGNPVARSPLMRKGGPHERSSSVQRQQSRLALYDELEEWFETLGEDKVEESETGGVGSPFFFVNSVGAGSALWPSCRP
jgi:hypothetical protein